MQYLTTFFRIVLLVVLSYSQFLLGYILVKNTKRELGWIFAIGLINISLNTLLIGILSTSQSYSINIYVIETMIGLTLLAFSKMVQILIRKIDKDKFSEYCKMHRKGGDL